MATFKQVKEKAKALRLKVEGFTLLECATALATCEGNELEAIKWLEDPFRLRPLISFDLSKS
jgi:translation elongation factor EF-Ts